MREQDRKRVLGFFWQERANSPEPISLDGKPLSAFSVHPPTVAAGGFEFHTQDHQGVFERILVAEVPENEGQDESGPAIRTFAVHAVFGSGFRDVQRHLDGLELCPEGLRTETCPGIGQTLVLRRKSS